jgi:hypothetical protein
MTTLLQPPSVREPTLAAPPKQSWLRRHRLVVAIVAACIVAAGIVIGVILGTNGGGTTTTAVRPQGTVSDFIRSEIDFMNRLSPQDAYFAQRSLERQYMNGPGDGAQPGSAAWQQFRQGEIAWMNAGSV